MVEKFESLEELNYTLLMLADREGITPVYCRLESDTLMYCRDRDYLILNTKFFGEVA